MVVLLVEFGWPKEMMVWNYRRANAIEQPKIWKKIHAICAQKWSPIAICDAQCHGINLFSFDLVAYAYAHVNTMVESALADLID